MLKYITFQASRKSTIKRNCILYDSKENFVIHAGKHYKLSKTKINDEEQKEKIKTNDSCMFYSIPLVTNTIDCNEWCCFLIPKNYQFSNSNKYIFKWSSWT